MGKITWTKKKSKWREPELRNAREQCKWEELVTLAAPILTFSVRMCFFFNLNRRRDFFRVPKQSFNEFIVFFCVQQLTFFSSFTCYAGKDRDLLYFVSNVSRESIPKNKYFNCKRKIDFVLAVTFDCNRSNREWVSEYMVSLFRPLSNI